MISLPSHFKVDDPENSGFGRRLRNKNFNNDQIIQASTLEEVRALEKSGKDLKVWGVLKDMSKKLLE